MKALGLDVKHEKWGSSGIISWTALFPDGKYGAYKDTAITLHQTREPLGCIGSMTVIADANWNWIMEKVPEIKKSDSLVLRGMKMYVLWNSLCEEQADMTYQVECIDRDQELDIPHNISSRNHEQITWNRLKKENPVWAGKVAESARKYGYDVD